MYVHGPKAPTLSLKKMIVVTMTTSEYAYGSASNLFGSDPESVEEHSILVGLRVRASTEQHATEICRAALRSGIRCMHSSPADGNGWCWAHAPH